MFHTGRFVFFFFLAGYLAVIYPLAYFRHDDWLILGNAVRHFADDWSFAFAPTLYFLNEEVVWFFRPFFKILPLIFFNTLGLNYYLWLASLLGFTVASFWFTYQSVRLLTQSIFWSTFSVLLFVSSVHLHFGSLFWVGEGMMNCPQLFFLSACTYAFLCSLREKGKRFFGWQALSWAALLIAVGFKESSIFHGVFLALLLLLSPTFDSRSLKSKTFVILPLAIFTLAFLYVRLIVMPINPYYVPKWNLAEISREIAVLIAAYLGPLLIWFGVLVVSSKESARRYSQALLKQLPYAGFLALCLVPYLGHSFFSPGWFMVPAYYFFFVLALAGHRAGITPAWQALRVSATLVLLLSLIPVAYRLYELRWWEWKPSQVYAQQIIASLPDESVDEIVVFNCVNPAYPDLNFDRVIGFEAGLYQMWAIHHPNPIPVIIRDCSKLKPRHANSKKKLMLYFQFPTLTWLNEQALKSKSAS